MATPNPKSPRVVTCNGDDVNAAMTWLEGTLASLPPQVRDARLRAAPPVEVLLAYRQALLTAPEA